MDVAERDDALGEQALQDLVLAQLDLVGARAHVGAVESAANGRGDVPAGVSVFACHGLVLLAWLLTARPGRPGAGSVRTRQEVASGVFAFRLLYSPELPT